MRRLLIACVVMILATTAVYTAKAPVITTLAGAHPGVPVASIDEIFRRF